MTTCQVNIIRFSRPKTYEQIQTLDMVYSSYVCVSYILQVYTEYTTISFCLQQSTLHWGILSLLKVHWNLFGHSKLKISQWGNSLGHSKLKFSLYFPKGVPLGLKYQSLQVEIIHIVMKIWYGCTTQVFHPYSGSWLNYFGREQFLILIRKWLYTLLTLIEEI